jgi:transketolase
VLEMDGHNMPEVIETLRGAHRGAEGQPTVVVANTVKGKGVSFMERQFAWHAKPLSDDLRLQALEELRSADSDRV